MLKFSFQGRNLFDADNPSTFISMTHFIGCCKATVFSPLFKGFWNKEKYGGFSGFCLLICPDLK